MISWGSLVRSPFFMHDGHAELLEGTPVLDQSMRGTQSMISLALGTTVCWYVSIRLVPANTDLAGLSSSFS